MGHYTVAVIGTLAVVIAALAAGWAFSGWTGTRRVADPEKYRRRKLATTLLATGSAAAIAALWARMLPQRGTFFGLIGAGLAVALREPLLSIAGRIAIFAGHMYTVGDRIEISQMSGDVIDVGFFYTRLMEIGNWVHADQATGRIMQFSNSIVFGNTVANYTQNFSYIWDEVILPVTYSSNVKAAIDILQQAADQYTKEFLSAAREELDAMRHSFTVPKLELEPTVYVQVTDNYVKLTLRYIVDPKNRRGAKSFIFQRTLDLLRDHSDITIGSSTMDLTVHRAPGESDKAA